MIVYSDTSWLLSYLNEDDDNHINARAAAADLKTAVVEPALQQRVIQFIGTNEKTVHHIALRGLWIAHAASTYFEPYSPAGMGDYTIQRGGAVYLEGAEDVTVDRCSLEGNNGNGFYVNGHARRVLLTNSRVVDVGESGSALPVAADLAGARVVQDDVPGPPGFQRARIVVVQRRELHRRPRIDRQ